MKKQLILLLFLIVVLFSEAQTVEEVINKVKANLDRVNDYVATGKMKTNVLFIKAPVATVKVFYKKPNKIIINN